MLWNALRVALTEVRRNLMRSVLTILGIVIGVAAVITMVTMGSGATARIGARIASLGSNLLIVLPGRSLGPGEAAMVPPFDMDDGKAILTQVRTVHAVSPQSTSSQTAIYGNENWSTTVAGVTDGFFAVRDWPVEPGRTFQEAELRAGAAVCIIGDTVRRELLGDAPAVGERIRLGRLSCRVIGVLAPKGQVMGRDQDDLVLVPLRTFQRRISGNTDVAAIQVSVAEARDIDKAKAEITRLMRERRRISPAEDDDFTVLDTREIVDMLTSTTRVLTLLFGAVAAVSLLVGGIGIMNIMLVSVTERTREIGIRLAIGALEHEVLTQFLVEAAVLSSFGGVIGIVVALAASATLADLLDVPLIIQPGVIVAAFAFSVAVGVVFGFLPARRAARLDPIEALRHE
ncbi:MAG: ABC transporter permease [Rhodospirillaceae bacterium]|nr:ABC transporter permease [Rhodospirillaceae bacterium]